MNIFINNSFFEGSFQAVSIVDASKIVSIDSCYFQRCYSGSAGGAIYVNVKDALFTRICGLSTSAAGSGSFIYMQTIEKGNNSLCLCSTNDCTSTAGPIIYQITGTIFLENTNSTYGKGWCGAYIDESSSVYAYASFCDFVNIISTEYAVFDQEQIVIEGTNINKAHHVSFKNCTCLKPGSWSLMNSHVASASFWMVSFVGNNIEASYLVGQSNVGYIELSQAYFEPSNKCKAFISSKVDETEPLSTDPNMILSPIACRGRALNAQEALPLRFGSLLLNIFFLYSDFFYSKAKHTLLIYARLFQLLNRHRMKRKLQHKKFGIFLHPENACKLY